MRWKPFLILGSAAALGISLICLGVSMRPKPPGPGRLYPDTPTIKTPPDNAATDLLHIDFVRKDNPAINRLETAVFIHFHAVSPLARSFKNLKFIQIVRENDGAWRIDENSLGTRKAYPTATNPGPFPYFPRQFLGTDGIYLYDRPGHGADPPPEAHWTFSWTFPFNSRVITRKTQPRTFTQEFESCVVGVADGKYHLLGSVTWGHAFQDGQRISDHFGPFIPPPGQISGTTDFFAPAPASPNFDQTLQAQAPTVAPE